MPTIGQTLEDVGWHDNLLQLAYACHPGGDLNIDQMYQVNVHKYINEIFVSIYYNIEK